jgi:LacI family transcriptional regulator
MVVESGGGRWRGERTWGRSRFSWSTQWRRILFSYAVKYPTAVSHHPTSSQVPVRPSLRTIAALAGVTSMTVSLALRDHPSISTTTRMQHLRTRRAQRTQTTLCGLRMRPAPLTAQGYDYGQQAAEGARRRAESLGFRFEEMFIDEPGLTPRRLQRILSSRGVEGVVLLPMVRPVALARLLDWTMGSTVAATSSVLAPRLHTVIPDQFGNMLLLCRKLEERGLRLAGLATHTDHDVRVDHRMAAAHGWHNAVSGRAAIPPLVIDREHLDAKALLRWVEDHALEAVVSDSESDLDLIVAALPLRWRRKLTLVSTSVHPPLARYPGINEKPDEVGAAAIETLAAMIQRGERGLPGSPRTVSIAGEYSEPKRG